MKFIDAMNEFFDYLITIGRSPITISTYRKNLRRYYKYLCNKKNREIYIDDITSNDFEQYLLDEELNFSKQAKYAIITVFKSFMGYCFKKGLCKVNIAKEIKQVKPNTKERTSLTENEFESIVDNVSDPVVKCVIYTMFYTGCRIGELIQLRTQDVDLDRNLIYIERPKGHSYKSRIIPINYKLRNLLIEYLSIRKGGDTEDSFFVLKRSGRISDSTVSRAINEAAKKAGIDRQITNHIMRHTFSSLLAEKGVDLKRIQALLGHSNLDTTNIYLHTNNKKCREAVNLIK